MKVNGPVVALGAMSGTSVDGVDAAAVLTDGETISGFGATGYRAYGDAERRVIRRAFGRWPDEVGVAEAAAVVEAAHVALLAEFEGVDLVGFHGQTLAHDPKGRGTHQAGDGQVLADALGLPVVWDFRSSDVALGGEGGAPEQDVYLFGGRASPPPEVAAEVDSTVFEIAYAVLLREGTMWRRFDLRQDDSPIYAPAGEGGEWLDLEEAYASRDAEALPALEESPQWADGADEQAAWPVHEGESMTFLTQVGLPENETTEPPPGGVTEARI